MLSFLPGLSPISLLGAAAVAIAATPWVAAPFVLAARLRTTPSLDDIDVQALTAAPTPRVSIVLPARNEAVHIAACIRSIRASTWPDLELIVVDDHSTDGTGVLAREAAADDSRVKIVNAPDLPAGWFGKQWACQSGAAYATGSLLLFTDADTRHAPELVGRMVRMRERRDAELLSVAGHQEMGTVWERAVQPSVFTLILTRYGGAEAMERATDRRDVVANGQCFMLSRRVYDAIGGHEPVRGFVAEDVMMAQAIQARGDRVSLALGIRQLSTRMYDGLASLMKGWGKNMYAGGRHAMWWGAVGQRLYPLFLLSFPLGVLMPFVTLTWCVLAMATGGTASTALLLWSGASSAAVLTSFAAANRINGDPMRRALLAPLGGAIVLAICVSAIARGNNVRWKDRGYVSQ
ncbi:glycosyltransferase [Gemmatimonas groenlandica]|uniref:Glycosyltransferase n=1 Tax=Gemmatimonas groenlandica TaxID=2732249 RepID=A0A6M4IJS4_9BACT|nr:glycosyltransferase [Gemmatimonas groenlandica]QJR34099.1 glycosyltransferase [Gemmatimonas groenlandica]